MAKDIFKRFLKRKVSVVAAFVLLLFILVAVFGPLFLRYTPTEQDLANTHAPVSSEHWLGTDYLGRDIFSRIVSGARISLSISFCGVFMGAVVGILLGLLAGYYGGVVDAVISRILEIMLAFPGLLIAILIVAVLGNGIFNTMLAVAFYGVPSLARVVRSSVISIKNNEYVQVCDVFGANPIRILFKHILPNSISILIVNITHSMGVQPPYAEWGAMLNSARDVLRLYPMEAIAPGMAITLAVLSFDMVGDGLRDALDPRLKNS